VKKGGKNGYARPSRFSNRSAVTLIEILLAVLMMSLLFGSGYGIMSYSRKETEKGFWIQQAITQLRNGTRALSMKLKMTSYPSTIIKKSSGGGDVQKVISFKEKREYDFTGRLRKLQVNPDDSFDMHAIITDGGGIAPNFNEQSIMYFPICTPERDTSEGYEEGTITWVELVLKPARHYNSSGLGSLHLIEREETYSTKSDPDRAFGLDKSFSKSIPVKTDKLIIDDVREVDIEYYEIDELRGVYVTKAGDKYEEHKKRILVSIGITCSHPKDGKIWLSDHCSVINNVGIVVMEGTNLMELIKIVSSGAGGSAIVKHDGEEKTVRIGETLGGYKVKDILGNAVILVVPDSNIERYLTLKES
jgi:hypothetical protein